MSMGTNFGVKINKPTKLANLYEYLFGEDQSRYIIEVDEQNLKKVDKILKNNNIYYENIGITQKDYFEVDKEIKIKNKDLFKINNNWYTKY